MDQYRLEGRKGDGTFSEVFMAYSIKTGKYVAIKIMKKKYDSIEKVKKMKQIHALKLLSSHKNIVKLIEILYDQPTGKLALVFQLMDKNLYQAIMSKRTQLNLPKIKYLMYQLLKAIDYTHKKGIFHRDIKPQNILITGQQVKLADYGSCKGICSKQPYTQYISTRWYRAPQCLMTDGYYDQKMDIWGFGCVLYQTLTKLPLFPGKNQLDQVHRIHNILGTPKLEVLERFKQKASHMQFNFTAKKGSGLEKLLPKSTPQTINLLNKLLIYDPRQRITAEQALNHEFFAQVQQLLLSKDVNRTFYVSQKSQDSSSTGKCKNTIKKKPFKLTNAFLPPIQIGIYIDKPIKATQTIFKKTFHKNK